MLEAPKLFYFDVLQVLRRTLFSLPEDMGGFEKETRNGGREGFSFARFEIYSFKIIENFNVFFNFEFYPSGGGLIRGEYDVIRVKKAPISGSRSRERNLFRRSRGLVFLWW